MKLCSSSKSDQLSEALFRYRQSRRNQNGEATRGHFRFDGTDYWMLHKLYPAALEKTLDLRFGVVDRLGKIDGAAQCMVLQWVNWARRPDVPNDRKRLLWVSPAGFT